MLHTVNIVLLNINNSKLYNTARSISARRAVAGRRKAMATSLESRSSSPPPAELPCTAGGAEVTDHEEMRSIRERRDLP